MNRGRVNEAKVLKDIGEVKNTQKFDVGNDLMGEQKVIPDAITDKSIIEIKDTKAVYSTKQIRGEMELAKRENKQLEIITGEKTHISGNINQEEIKITRRKDIGPQ